jgi:hypothetical protein
MKYSKASTTIEKKQRNVRQLTDQWTRSRRKKNDFLLNMCNVQTKEEKTKTNIRFFLSKILLHLVNSESVKIIH